MLFVTKTTAFQLTSGQYDVLFKLVTVQRYMEAKKMWKMPLLLCVENKQCFEKFLKHLYAILTTKSKNWLLCLIIRGENHNSVFLVYYIFIRKLFCLKERASHVHVSGCHGLLFRTDNILHVPCADFFSLQINKRERR